MPQILCVRVRVCVGLENEYGDCGYDNEISHLKNIKCLIQCWNVTVVHLHSSTALNYTFRVVLYVGLSSYCFMLLLNLKGNILP